MKTNKQANHPFSEICKSKFPGKCLKCGRPTAIDAPYGQIWFRYGVGIKSGLQHRKGTLCNDCHNEIGTTFVYGFKEAV